MRDKAPSSEYVEYICNLYGDVYDDRLEDCRPPAAGDELRNPGEDWKPGQVAEHKSLAAFQKELEVHTVVPVTVNNGKQFVNVCSGLLTN